MTFLKYQKHCLIVLLTFLFLSPGFNVFGEEELVALKYNIQLPGIEKLKMAVDAKGEKFSTFTRVRLESARVFGKPGEPALPVKTARILIPPGHQIASVEVEPGREIHLKGEFVIEPGQVEVPTSKKTFEYTPPNPEIYNSDRPFPESIYSKPVQQNFRGFNIAVIEYVPFKYIPAKKRLYYFENLRIVLKTTKRKEKGKTFFRKKSLDFEKIKKMIDNPEMLKHYKDVDSAKLRSRALSPGDWDMVIVTNNTLTPTFQAYANWRTNYRGIRTIVYDISTILSTYSGYDDAEKLRNFIIEAYFNWGIEYVLLGGDVEIVPHRKLYCEYSIYEENIPADIYFAGLDGDWDYDNDHIYGEMTGTDEADLFAEVYVGRAPVNSVSEAQNFCNKIRSYEESNLDSYRCDWLFFTTELSTTTFGGYYKDDTESEELHPPHNFNITKVYEYLGGTNTQVINGLNAGQRIGNSCGHGNTNGFGMINSTDVDNLTNTEYHLIYTWACWTNAFDQTDCIGEHFLYTEHGAFAYIGNSRYGWYSNSGDASGSSHSVELEFYDALIDEEIPRLGKALQDSKEEFSGSSSGSLRWITYALNLMGDPSTLLRVKNDVWIKTGSADDGSIPASSPFWTSPDIAVDSPAGGWQTPSPFIVHENPEFGSINRVYIRVRNPGCEDANDVNVRVYWADPAGGIPWPSDWNYIGAKLIPTVPHGGEVVTPYIEWTPSGAAIGHRCLLAVAECNSDPVSIHNPSWDNNVAMKNVTIVDLMAEFKLFKTKFVLNPIVPRERRDLKIAFIDAPDNVEVKLLIPYRVKIGKGMADTHIKKVCRWFFKRRWKVTAVSSPQGRPVVVPNFSCKKKEKVSLYIKFPPGLKQAGAGSGKRTFVVRITEELDGKTIGGIDYLVRY